MKKYYDSKYTNFLVVNYFVFLLISLILVSHLTNSFNIFISATLVVVAPLTAITLAYRFRYNKMVAVRSNLGIVSFLIICSLLLGINELGHQLTKEPFEYSSALQGSFSYYEEDSRNIVIQGTAYKGDLVSDISLRVPKSTFIGPVGGKEFKNYGAVLILSEGSYCSEFKCVPQYTTSLHNGYN